MQWGKRSSNSIQAGEFIIGRVTVQGVSLFTLWRGNDRISDHGTADEAKAKSKRISKEAA